MAKPCCICGKNLSLLSFKFNLRDGVLCHKCAKACGIKTLESGKNVSTSNISEVFGARVEALRKFRATNTFYCLEIDANTHSFKLEDNFYLFSELLSYSFHEDPSSSRHSPQNEKSGGAAIGGVIGGLSGGLIGGAIGAVVGGKIGSLFAATCEHMYISVSLNSILGSNVRLDFINGETRTSSPEYTEAKKHADDCMCGFQMIADYNTRALRAASTTVNSQYSKREVFIQGKHLTASEFADEIEIYKALLYNGDITQEEFNAKKKKLLDMM